MTSIVEKCDDIQTACSDHFAIKHLKTNSQKIKDFVAIADAKEKKNEIIAEIPKSASMKNFKYESPLEFNKGVGGDNCDDK